MTLRTILLLLVALAVAGGTAFYANSWISAERAALARATPAAEAPKVERRTEVLVARADIPAGSFLGPDSLRWQAWPEDGIIPAYVVRGADGGTETVESYLGAVARSSIVAGQPVSASLVVHPGDRGFLAAVLTPGARAVSVPVNATSGIAGFVFPGDHVDVLVTVKHSEESGQGPARTRHFSQTLLEKVRVLAIDQQTENTDAKISIAKTATLEVSAKQAETVALALEMGSLSLSLHSLALDPDDMGDDTEIHGGRQVRVAEKSSITMDWQAFAPFAAATGGGHQVSVVRGSDASRVTF